MEECAVLDDGEFATPLSILRFVRGSPLRGPVIRDIPTQAFRRRGAVVRVNLSFGVYLLVLHRAERLWWRAPSVVASPCPQFNLLVKIHLFILRLLRLGLIVWARLRCRRFFRETLTFTWVFTCPQRCLILGGETPSCWRLGALARRGA